MKKKLPPIHPGEILKEEFMEPLKLSANCLAMELHVPATRIGEIVKGKRSITPETALRLSVFFGNSYEFWMGLQIQYELEVLEDKLGETIAKQITPYKMPRCS